jgi:hypothetical protein
MSKKVDNKEKKNNIVDKEMSILYHTLVRKNTPTVNDEIYLSDGLYLLPNGDVIER